ncbi:MAG: hypothetical protein K8F90_20510 [Hyphomicrobiales bacterium]|nr:hypothetical protein [Hyphomicrobiales bacterium]
MGQGRVFNIGRRRFPIQGIKFRFALGICQASPDAGDGFDAYAFLQIILLLGPLGGRGLAKGAQDGGVNHDTV